MADRRDHKLSKRHRACGVDLSEQKRWIIEDGGITVQVNVKTDILSKGGIRCLSCHEVSTPSECSQWVTCGQDEECFVREFQNRYMETVYHLGCEQQERCDLIGRMSALLGKRNLQKCFACCNHDDCNGALCGGSSTIGAPGPQSRCLDCHSVTDPRLCDTWSRCGVDEICYTRSFMDAGQLKFKLGCEHRDTCLPPRTASTPAPSPWECTECCHYDDCNAKRCLSVVGYQTHSSNNVLLNGCPPSFIRGNNSCYYFSNVTVPWASANERCKNMSASLVAIETKTEVEVLNKILNDTTLSKASGYWTGGYYVTATRNWHWVDLQLLTMFDWGPQQPSSVSNSYRIVLLNPAHNTGYTHWQWATGSYSSGYYYICETGAKTAGTKH